MKQPFLEQWIARHKQSKPTNEQTHRKMAYDYELIYTAALNKQKIDTV